MSSPSQGLNLGLWLLGRFLSSEPQGSPQSCSEAGRLKTKEQPMFLIWSERREKAPMSWAQRQSGRRNSSLLSLGLVRPSPDWMRPTLQRAICFLKLLVQMFISPRNTFMYTQSNTSIVFQILPHLADNFQVQKWLTHMSTGIVICIDSKEKSQQIFTHSVS